MKEIGLIQPAREIKITVLKRQIDGKMLDDLLGGDNNILSVNNKTNIAVVNDIDKVNFDMNAYYVFDIIPTNTYEVNLCNTPGFGFIMPYAVNVRSGGIINHKGDRFRFTHSMNFVECECVGFGARGGIILKVRLLTLATPNERHRLKSKKPIHFRHNTLKDIVISNPKDGANSILGALSHRDLGKAREQLPVVYSELKGKGINTTKLTNITKELKNTAPKTYESVKQFKDILSGYLESLFSAIDGDDKAGDTISNRLDSISFAGQWSMHPLTRDGANIQPSYPDEDSIGDKPPSISDVVEETVDDDTPGPYDNPNDLDGPDEDTDFEPTDTEEVITATASDTKSILDQF